MNGAHAPALARPGRRPSNSAYSGALAKRQRLYNCSSALGAVMVGALVVQFWPSTVDPEARWESDDALLMEICSLAGFQECQSNLETGSSQSAQRCSLPRLNLKPDTTVPENAFHVGPLLLGNMTEGWSASRVWQRRALLRRYGSMQVKAGYPADLAEKGTKASTFKLELSALLDRWRNGDQELFLFQTDNADNMGNCNSLGCVLRPSGRDASVPEFRVAAALKSMDSLIASMGPSEQGLPLHSHGAAWQALLHGRKLWVLLPPGPLSVPGLMGKSARQLLEMSRARELGDHKAFICLQEPGEMIVVPHLWRHATMNIGEAVAVGGQVRAEMLDGLLQCLEPLVKGKRVKSYEEGFAVCERRWKEEQQPLMSEGRTPTGILEEQQ